MSAKSTWSSLASVPTDKFSPSGSSLGRSPLGTLDSVCTGKRTIVSSSCIQREEASSTKSSTGSLLLEDGPATQAVDVYGVRIQPAVVRFENTFENQSYMEKVSIQNISDSSLIVRIHNPRAWSFRVTQLERGHSLAPGLKITRHVHYTSTKNGMVQSTLPIYINENLYEIKLEACKGQAFVEIIPTTLNFGRVDIGCKPVEKKILIKNVSFCATKFMVDVGSNYLDLLVGPMKGWIRPHSSVTITVQLLALREGKHSSELWITTDLYQARIQLEMEACRRSLMVLHPNTIADFTLVDFPVTFYGCRRYQTVIVYNMAASSTAFVVLADYGCKGQMPLAEAKKEGERHVNMFDVEPLEGRIRPFEERIFTFWFNPQLMYSSEKINQKNVDEESDIHDYLCAIRIKRIQVDDFGSDTVSGIHVNPDAFKNTGLAGSSPSNSNADVGIDKELDDTKLPQMDNSLLEDISLLFYLYGEAEVPSLSALPDSIRFPNTPIGSNVVRVVQLANDTNHMLAFQYRKIPFLKVYPEFKKLAPKSKLDLKVELCARSIGVLKKNLTFEVLAQENASDKQDFRVVNKVVVKIFAVVLSQKVVPEPKFNPGITPMISNEVGFMTDEVTFVSKVEKPRCAVMAKSEQGRPWHRTDAVVAFPNDRPLTLRPRTVDALAKTIYKGIPRYIAPVDESVTYTLDQLMKKKANDDWFLRYIRGTAAVSVTEDRCCQWKPMKIEADPPLMLIEKKEAKLPREVFVPLTFVQLYRISVSPPVVSFGSVTTSKRCSQLLSIENGNDFEISARIIPLTSGIGVETLENFIISENSEAKIMLTFQREILGRYSGTVTCVINGYHSFDIAVVAEVVHRSLTITPEYVEIRIADVPFATKFVPIAINNPLNIPVTFSWIIPDESPIKIEPVTGVTPKLGTVWCVVFFEPENPNFKLHPIKLMVEGTVCHKLRTGVVLPKTNVYMLEPVLNVGDIPMNLTTYRRFFIFNPDFSNAMYVVLNKEPIKGVKVTPCSGTIKSKSCKNLMLQMRVSSEKILDFTIFVTLQNSTTIELKVVGNVVYPEVEFTPQYINLHRVPCNSITRTTLIAENKSRATAEVGFDMEEYPQFKVSLSKRHHDPGLNRHGFTLEPGASQKLYLHFIPKDLASYEFYLPVIINKLMVNRFTTEKEMETQRKLIKAKSCDRRRNSCVATVMTHLVLVDVVVLKPSLIISALELPFSTAMEIKSFSITNASEQPLAITCRPDDSAGHFDCRVESDDVIKDRSSFKKMLDPGESMTMTVTFTTMLAGTHVCDVTILTTVEEQSFVYNVVRLTGNISFPCVIVPSAKEIYFHPVPLNVNVSVVCQLNICQNQLKETVISYEINNQYTELFSVEYPYGNVVTGVTNYELPVTITFCSLYPVSIKQSIIFKGSGHGRCSITLIATADNCLMTTHAYLKAYSKFQPGLKSEKNGCEEVCERHTLTSMDRAAPASHSMTRSPTAGSSSGSSTKSLLSLNTHCSSNLTWRPKRSAVLTHHSKSSSVTSDKEQLLSNSDIDLSLQLNDKEEKTLSKRESKLTEVMKEDEESFVFPMFPDEHAVSENAIHMMKTQKAIQQWIYEQIFCCSFNPILGTHSFAMFTAVNNKKEYGHSSPAALKNVFDALERICGRRIRRYFTPIDKIPEEPTARAMFAYNLYGQLLDFMEMQGALMAHIEPEYLMPYEDYKTYVKTSPADKYHELLSTGSQFSYDSNPIEVLSVKQHESLSHQCWLDLALQMFKTLILGPTVGVTYYTPPEFTKRATRVAQEFDPKKHVYGKVEEILMSWLTHQYNSQRTVVWPHKPPPPRTVSNFDMDLEDGLVLTATTAAYCPYLNQIHFQDMCLNPSTISQAYHNTTCLCMAWDCIKLGYSVTPRDFVNPNTIKMLLLVTHLYRILPTYKPETTISFKATLNASESQIVILENNEEVSITYHVEILPHTANFFLEDCQNTLVLKRKSKCHVGVQYLARNTNKAEAILILCGACMPPKFGRNYVFKLEGYPVKLPVSASFNIISPQNTPLDTQITVESPHTLELKGDESYTYDLWVAFTEPQPGNLNAVSWAKERKRKIPRRLFFTNNTLVITASKKKCGSGTLYFKVCCFSQIVFHYWLIFRNPDIGDFIVKLTITPCKPDPVTSVFALIDQDGKCSCSSERSPNCSRSLVVNIPCRNLAQWSSIRTMFELTISPAEKEFWSAYLESNIGFRLLQWMLEEKKEKLTNELESLFKKSKTYKVTCSSKNITCMTSVCLPDVRSKSSVPVELHFDDTTIKQTAVLTLVSEDGTEMRSYNLKVNINNKKASL